MTKIETVINKDLRDYKERLLKSILIFLSFIALLIIMAFLFSLKSYQMLLLGLFIGAFMSALNVFALAFAAYYVLIKKNPGLKIFLPILSFLSMCMLCFLMVFYASSMTLGFAFGLTAPIVFAALMMFGMNRTLKNGHELQ